VSSINNIVISEPSWLASNVSKVAGIDLQNNNNDISLSDIRSQTASAIHNKMELGSGSESNLNPAESNVITLLQPQYAFNTPVNKTHNSFQSILESHYENYSGNYQKNKSYKLKHHNSTKGYNSIALPEKDYEVKGYYLTIPPEQMEKMNSFPPLSSDQQKLKDAFSAGQNTSIGTLVDLRF
jgi:hypothetical protein